MADIEDEVDFSKMKVPELKKVLKERGLATTGNKAELIERLQQVSDGGEEILEEDLNEDVLIEDDEEEEESVLEEKEETTEKENQEDVKSIKENEPTKDQTSSSNSVHKTKIVTLSGLTASGRLEQRAQRFGAVSEVSKKQLRSERFGLTDVKDKIKSDDNKTTKSATSVVSAVDPDKLKQRADRFGTAVSSANPKVQDVDKLKKRAERFGQVTSTALALVDTQEKLGKRKERFGVPIEAPGSDEQAKKKLRADRFGDK